MHDRTELLRSWACARSIRCITDGARRYGEHRIRPGHPGVRARRRRWRPDDEGASQRDPRRWGRAVGECAVNTVKQSNARHLMCDRRVPDPDPDPDAAFEFLSLCGRNSGRDQTPDFSPQRLDDSKADPDPDRLAEPDVRKSGSRRLRCRGGVAKSHVKSRPASGLTRNCENMRKSRADGCVDRDAAITPCQLLPRNTPGAPLHYEPACFDLRGSHSYLRASAGSALAS